MSQESLRILCPFLLLFFSFKKKTSPNDESMDKEVSWSNKSLISSLAELLRHERGSTRLGISTPRRERKERMELTKVECHYG